jgi:competence protein ComEA
MGKQWLRYVRNFFGFSRQEARGFTVMVVLLLLVGAALLVYRLLPATPYAPQADQQQLDSLIALLEEAGSLAPATAEALAQPDLGEAERLLFDFNPNTVSQDSLLALGFSPALAQRLINYRSKGGNFRKKEDLRKLYGLPEALYQRLEPHIKIPAPPPKPSETLAADKKRETPYQPFTPSERTAPAPFDLNTADSLQLQQIRGIGPVLSARIVKYREALGGFITPEQLREVWGLPPEVADALLELAYLAPESVPKQLPINLLEAEELASHPYINRKQAGWIVAYRRQHGNYRQARDLLRIHQLDAAFVQKITPYLTFDAPEG